MTQDAEDVQKDDVSKETPLPPPDVLPESGAPDQPLTRAMVKELISEAVEPFKRQAQSASDRAQDAQDRARLAEETLAGIEGLDPDATELATLRARDKHYQARNVQERQRQQMDVFAKNFRANMNQFITEMGIDPNEKGIDWGDDAKDYLTKQQRILASVGKIQKESGKASEEKLKQDQKDFEAKIRKDLGLDSVDTSASLGAGGSDAEFLKKFGTGELPYSKENVERANKIMNK